MVLNTYIKCVMAELLFRRYFLTFVLPPHFGLKKVEFSSDSLLAILLQSVLVLPTTAFSSAFAFGMVERLASCL